MNCLKTNRPHYLKGEAVINKLLYYDTHSASNNMMKLLLFF